jgi:hypothetical protein
MNKEYMRTNKPTVHIGVVLPTNIMCENFYIFFLDDNNKLWYADRKDIVNDGECLDFRIVYFQENNDEDEELRNCASSILYGPPIHKHKAKKIKVCKFLNHASNVQIDENYDNYIYDIKREDLDLAKDNKLAHLSYGGWYKEYGIVAFSLSSSEDSDENKIELFVVDEISMTYRKLNPKTTPIFFHLINDRKTDCLVTDWDSIHEIYKTVCEFNPYEVFESYRIEIEHYVQSRIGKDNYYYEYKTYYIKYIDEYLKKWFYKKKEQLHFDSGYTSHFREVNPYKRFFEEEEKAKNTAYKEYSKIEHFDYLMRHYYEIIKEHIDNLNNITKMQYEWIDEELHIKDAYGCLNSLWGHAFDHCVPQKKDFERFIENGLARFNNADECND